jgi:hypothetical protein
MMEKYSAIEEKLKPGDVILTAHKGFKFESALIKIANFFKRGYKERNWTHSALYIGDGQIVEVFPKGAIQRKFRDGYLDNKHNLLVLRHKKASQEQLRKAIDFCVSEESKKYDFRGMFYFVAYDIMPEGLHFILENDFIGSWFKVEDSYFCSELVSSAFLAADAYCFEKEPAKVMPIDFYNHLWFDLVDKYQMPENRESLWYRTKASIFCTLYVFSALAVLFILIIIGHILLLAAIIGFILVIASVLTLNTLRSKQK